MFIKLHFGGQIKHQDFESMCDSILSPLDSGMESSTSEKYIL
jgi:hypothetical protein